MRFRRVSLPPGHLASPASPECYVFDSWGAWEAAYGPASPRPRVDFGGEIVIALHMGLCETGGFSVQITAVSVRGGELAITARYRRPGPTDFVTLAPTSPRDMIAVPRAALARGVGAGGFSLAVRDQEGRVRVEMLVDRAIAPA
jgi:hypothetical protein